MELLRTARVHLYIFLCLSFLECHFCRQVSSNVLASFDTSENKAVEDGSSQVNSRNSKQFMFPVVAWPYSLGIDFLSNSNQPFPSYVPLQYHLPFTYAVIPTTQTRDGKFSQHLQADDQQFSNHASDDSSVSTKQIPCNTQENELGICQSFTKCFPMMEVQYGSANYIDFMDVPLAEQLVLSTNATVCSQSENVEENLKVCCPHSTFKIPKALLHSRENYYDGTSTDFHDDVVKLPPMITQRPPLRNGLSRQLINEQKCGNPRLQKGIPNRPQGKITGGQEARGPQEFPWMVAVFGKNRKIFCGASLISDQYLLSASHCYATIKPNSIGDLYVHLGDFNLKTTTDGPHQVRKIEKIILHKGFKIENYHNDISLLKLDKPVNFTDRISPICLPEATVDSLEKREIIVTGWGRKYRYGTTSDVLRKVQMPVWNLQECKNLYSRFAPGRVLDSNICAGDGKRNKDACLGDSGGPAVMFDGKKYVLVGITSWGKGCGSFPGVYTRTSKFLMWIAKHLNQLA